MAHDVGELTRQYQGSLENLRRVTNEFADLFSADDIVADAKAEVSKAREVLEIAWMEAL